MGVPEPRGSNGADAREPPRATAPDEPAAAGGAAAQPPPSYRIGGADAPPRPTARPARVRTLIVLLLLLACAMGFAIVQWRTQHALASATAAANREAERAAEEASRTQQAALEREAAKQQQLRAEAQARRRELDEQRQAEQTALDATREREQARERAWAAFYRPAAGCKDATTVECANAYIRARRAFEKQYSPPPETGASAPTP